MSDVLVKNNFLKQSASGKSVSITGLRVRTLKTLGKWQFNYISRRQLKAMTSHQLCDLGLYNQDISTECRKFFWQD